MNYYVYLKICIWNDWRAKTGAKHLLIFCFECFFILLLTFLKNHFKGSCTRSGCRSINGIRFSNMKRNDLKHYSTLSTHFLVLLLIWNLIWLLPFRKRTTGSRCTPRAEGQHKRKWRRYTFEWCEQNDVKKKSYCAIIRRRSMLLLVSKSYPVIILNVCWTMLNDHDHNHTQSCVVLRGKKKEYSQKHHFHVICSDRMAGTPAIFPSCAAITICLWQWKAHRSEEEPILFELPYKKVDSSSNKRLSDSSWRITAYYMQSRDGRYVLPSSVDYASAPIVTDQSHCHTEKKSHFFLRLAFWLCICTGANGMSPARRLAFNRIFLGVEVEKTNKKYPRRRKKVM